MLDIKYYHTLISFVIPSLQVDIDFEKEPIGPGKDGKSVYFKDIWPSTEEIAEVTPQNLRNFLVVLYLFPIIYTLYI